MTDKDFQIDTELMFWLVRSEAGFQIDDISLVYDWLLLLWTH